MTKEKAKQWIKDLISTMKLETSGLFPDAPYEDEVYEALEMAIKALEQESRWIPTSERYPKIEDEYKYFLVTDDKGKVSVQEFFISFDEEPQPYFSGMINVIAWMPLPKSYKAESEVKG